MKLWKKWTAWRWILSTQIWWGGRENKKLWGWVWYIENICNVKDSNYKPKDKNHYKYIELSNIGNRGDITGFTYDLGKNLPTRARRLVNTNDIILSSVEGSLQKIALVTEKFDNSLCSTGFYVINSSKINSETLLVLFKNSVIQEILKQNCSGTILTAINKDDFLKIVIPIIDPSIQTQIDQQDTKIISTKKRVQRAFRVG